MDVKELLKFAKKRVEYSYLGREFRPTNRLAFVTSL